MRSLHVSSCASGGQTPLPLRPRCLKKGLETNCPICCDFLFTSSKEVRAVLSGHSMHSTCLQAYTCSHYTCTIYGKSFGDMAVSCISFYGIANLCIYGTEVNLHLESHDLFSIS
uniref:Uncharacterized protein n=1 Tax=Aegilops tauschii subsp. strangulata TaxID=200361 RepID=A0A453N3Q6_AEGTS